MSLFGGGSSSSSNDPFALFAAMQQAQAAQQQTQLGTDWLSFAQQAYGDSQQRQAGIDALTGQVTQAQLDSMNQANQWATEDRARYKSIFQPLQDQFISKAQSWDSQGALTNAANEARADVMSNAAAAKAAGQREMAARGIRPDSGAYQGIERAADLETGLAAAGAQNVARNQRRTQAMGLLGDAINIGSGLPSQALEASKTGLGAGSYASANQLNAEQNWRGNLGIMNSGFDGAGGLYRNAGNSWGDVYSNRVGALSDQQKIDALGSSSIMGGLGSLAGLGLGGTKPWILSDENAKEDKREVKGILDALKKMPVEAWKYKDGEGDGGEHVGTYAQDFKKATGLGDGKSINVVDALGVTMGAVKELAEKVEMMKSGGDGDEKSAKSSAHRSRAKSKSIFRKAA